MRTRQFLGLARIPTLTATAVPIMVGGALGYSVGKFDALAWLDILFVGLLMQIATNAMNEYGDYRHAVDEVRGPGFAGIIVSKEVSAREVLLTALTCYAAAFLLGLILVVVRGPVMLLLGGVAIMVGILYSEGPIPISSTPFGEVMVGLVMGLVEVVSADLAASGEISSLAAVYSIPVILTVMAILLANNVRDIGKDRDHGRHTLVVMIGRRRGMIVLFALIMLAFVWSFPAFLLFSTSASVFLLWLASPMALQICLQLKKDDTWHKSVAAVAKLHLIIGVLLTVSVLYHF